MQYVPPGLFTMYPVRLPPDTWSEASWAGSVATQEGDDFWMYQVFPHCGNLGEGLEIPLASGNGKSAVLSMHFVDFLRASLGVHAHALNRCGMVRVVNKGVASVADRCSCASPTENRLKVTVADQGGRGSVQDWPAEGEKNGEKVWMIWRCLECPGD